MLAELRAWRKARGKPIMVLEISLSNSHFLFSPLSSFSYFHINHQSLWQQKKWNPIYLKFVLTYKNFGSADYWVRRWHSGWPSHGARHGEENQHYLTNLVKHIFYQYLTKPTAGLHRGIPGWADEGKLQSVWHSSGRGMVHRYVRQNFFPLGLGIGKGFPRMFIFCIQYD